ncbi:5-carboxymethyl-2-hydroxymuconate delta isomerase [Streptomyces sp. SID161]|uniref:5-carboxymethyl-2-hydroxymuconate Delta-isomerase n=1 Tax=Streptomyces sp. SID161 TaxID=2690251 RepID=UPI00136D4604|nr:5-carboxymethyl-2-hydroxymuconate delta isomerase [Streptomyces sp. SID161]MYW15377.1 5-carboxymethyl-2-hydroxymuconate delta isomerase [Streptomyces sp. SID2955]MYW42038.1 5-carboxymethyl-2-hydroxymuconate delta isomerase [Streptomyces sp. SID161]
MPHLTLDHSAHLTGVLDADVLVKELHRLVVEESGSAGVCKTLVRPAGTYVGDTPDGEAGFLHLEVGLMPGRPEEQRARLSESALALLDRHLRTVGVRVSAVSVEVRELAGSYRLSSPVR